MKKLLIIIFNVTQPLTEKADSVAYEESVNQEASTNAGKSCSVGFLLPQVSWINFLSMEGFWLVGCTVLVCHLNSGSIKLILIFY